MEKHKPYIIQCKGRIGLAERLQLEALEVKLCEYFPDSAFLARLLNGRLEAVKNLPFVAEARPFEAAQKFAGGLLKALAVPPDSPVENKKVIVKLFEQSGAGAVVDFVRKNDGSVAGHGGHWLEIELRPEQLEQLALLHEVQCIEEKGEYELLNNRAGEIISVPSLWNKGLSGAGQIIGIADTGLDTGDRETLHSDLKSDVVAIYALGRKGDASDPNGHGTHVAGSACGKGSASQGRYRGMAPAASLIFQSVMDKDSKLTGLPADLGVLLKQAYDAGARVYNISWGMSVNGAYNFASAQLDRFVWEHDDMAVAIAAGNDGQPRSITSPGTAKNVITVGASENNRPEKGIISDNPAELAFFSSRGPAGDGRCKPDLVAPGTWILSTRSSLAQEDNFWGVEDQYYAYSSGTSMATPIVTGMLALVREYFIQVHGWQPSAALLKAALLDGAFALPGYIESDGGWGRINAPTPMISPTRKCLFVDQETKLATGESKTYEYQLSSAGGPLKITLVWTDHPAEVNASAALVNDLDLSVQSPSGQVFSPGDHVNNVEQVLIPEAAAGTYKVTVSGNHVPMGYQHYALFVSGEQLEQPGDAAQSDCSILDTARDSISGLKEQARTAPAFVPLPKDTRLNVCGVSGEKCGQNGGKVPVPHNTGHAGDIKVTGKTTASVNINGEVTGVELCLEGKLSGANTSGTNSTIVGVNLDVINTTAPGKAGDAFASARGLPPQPGDRPRKDQKGQLTGKHTGPHTLEPELSNSGAHTLTTGNEQAPRVSFNWPLEGVMISGITNLTINIISERPLQQVSFLVDGKTIKVFQYIRNVVPLQHISPGITLDTTNYPNGPLEIKVLACDIHNNSASSTVTPAVNNP